ncbi:MAG: amino acid permease [Planctomycetales bacterium]
MNATHDESGSEAAPLLSAEAGLVPEALAEQDRRYLAEHSLKKPLRALDIWALGVGVVITGEYFGWNLALRGNGPVAVLLASLIVCLLYLTWVLALSELSVAMPFAGGPLAYGRRAFGPWMGFVMGWSMFLECQFATIATALATGGYIAFLVNPGNPSVTLTTCGALGTVALFFVLHVWGVKEQSKAMVLMTYGAIVGLVLFWCLAATNFSWDRIWTQPVLPEAKGWRAVLDAIPYALWWLVMIETVALAAEEAHEAHRSIPRGLVWAQLTLIVLVGLTWLFACGAVEDFETLATNADGKDVSYPLAKVINLIPLGRNPAAVYGFGVIALFGMIASYHGMMFGTSRQAFALGRSGYLPAVLGEVHATRRTPVPSLLVCSLITAAFVVANLWFNDAIAVAVLISTLTALIWYILAIACLFVLRRREPELFSRYRAPLNLVLPVLVVVLSGVAAWIYSGIDVKVLPATLALYAGGLAYYFLWSRSRLRTAAPEELSARHAGR